VRIRNRLSGIFDNHGDQVWAGHRKVSVVPGNKVLILIGNLKNAALVFAGTENLDVANQIPALVLPFEIGDLSFKQPVSMASVQHGSNRIPVGFDGYPVGFADFLGMADRSLN